MRRVVAVKVVGAYSLELVFDDGTAGTVDLSRLAGKGIFAPWDDPAFFAQVRIGESGELFWGETIDLCPDALYLKVTGRTPEDVFPGLRSEPARA